MFPDPVRQVIEQALTESPGRRGEIMVGQHVRADMVTGSDYALSIAIPGRPSQVVTMRHQGDGCYVGSYYA